MGCSIATKRCASALAIALLGITVPAQAQSPTREGTAQALFEEGSSLFSRGDYDSACDKFRASNELDPKGGTLLNLALCREKQGRTASAWTTFSEARNRSLKEGRSERVAFAEKKIAELKPLLPRLRVVVTSVPRGLDVKVDGESLPSAAWNTGVPMDPGAHQVGATAPQYQPVTLTVRLAAGEETPVTVPALALIPPSAPPTRPEPVVIVPTRWTGWTILGAGILSVGVGSVFGVQAFNKRSEAESLCDSSRCDEGHHSNDAALRAAWISNIGIGVGLVAIVAGTYLLLRSPTTTTR